MIISSPLGAVYRASRKTEKLYEFTGGREMNFAGQICKPNIQSMPPGISPSGPPRFFEILVRSSNFVAGAISTELVAFQTSSPAQP
jgi:hypothetical protein